MGRLARWFGGLAVLAAMVASGCGEQGGSSSGGSGSGASGGDSGGNTILVGEYGSLTGSTATFGQTTHNGILLAVAEINAAGGINGKQVKHIWYDNRGNPEETKNVVKRLISSDEVVAVLGEVASGRSLVAAPICQQAGVPMITPSSTNPAVTEVGDKIFRVCFIDPDQGYSMAKFARDNLKLDRVAVLFDQKEAYSVGLKDNFITAFKELGGQITTEEAYSGGSTDYTAQLTSIKNTNPQAVYLPGYYTEAGNIARQAKQIGLNVPLMGGDGWESPKLAEIGGEAINGCYYSNHYAPEDQRPESQKFVAAYKKAYGEEPGALAALGYDSAMVLFDAIKRSPSLKGDDLAKAIAATKDFPGVTGKITLNQKRDAVKPMVILEMKDGKPTYVTTIEPPAR